MLDEVGGEEKENDCSSSAVVGHRRGRVHMGGYLLIHQSDIDN